MIGMEIEKYLKIQEEMRKDLLIENRIDKIERIAGVDQAFPNRKNVISCIVVLDAYEMSLIEKRFSIKETDFPYIPGLLSFREGPSIIDAYKKLKNKPDLLLIDGHGIAHPRRMGIASYIGIKLDIPTIGVAKRRLIGMYKEPKNEGEATKLIDDNKVIGYVLKSKNKCNPIFISPGYKIDIETSLRIVRNCLRKHKLPEPIRLAHLFVNERKRENAKI